MIMKLYNKNILMKTVIIMFNWKEILVKLKYKNLISDFASQKSRKIFFK